jgi:hypothetical protein
MCCGDMGTSYLYVICIKSLVEPFTILIPSLVTKNVHTVILYNSTIVRPSDSAP